MSSWQPPSGNEPTPYSAPSGSSFYGPPQPQKSSSNTWLWVLGAAVGVMLLGCCGACGGMMYFGMNVSNEEMIGLLRDNPKIRQHIGEIQSLNIDLVASGAEDDEDVFVYRVSGDKGSGRITVRESMDDEWNTSIQEATLRMSDGTQVQVVP